MFLFATRDTVTSATNHQPYDRGSARSADVPSRTSAATRSDAMEGRAAGRRDSLPGGNPGTVDTASVGLSHIGPNSRFADVLRDLLQRSGETLEAFASTVGVKASILRNWLSGHSVPTPRHHEAIRRIEDRAGLARGALGQLIRTRSRGVRAAAGSYRDIKDGRSTRDRVARLFSIADKQLPHDEFRSRYDAIKGEVTARTPAQFRPEVVRRRRETARAFVLGDQLANELALYRQLSQLTEIDVTAEYLPPKQRNSGGFDMHEMFLLSPMRYLATEHGCPPEELSLALLLFPRIVQLAVGAKQQRMVELGAAPTMRLSTTDVATFAAARDLVSPPGGFVFQRPEMFLPRLVEVPELVTAEMVATVAADWRGACAAAARRYEDLRGSFRQFVVTSVDRQAPVDALLHHPDPLHGLDLLNARLVKACLASDPAFADHDQLVAYAVQARISSDCAFRATTLSLLETSDLVETAGGWALEVAREKFKNPQGPYFRLHGGRFRDFERQLSGDHGIDDIIETYLSRVRPKLAGAHASTRLFLDIANRPAETRVSSPEISAKTLSRRSKAFTGQFLCGPDGIAGLAPFGAHNFRDIVATGTLKATNDPKAAADAIADSVDIVLAHYVRYWRPDAKDESGLR